MSEASEVLPGESNITAPEGPTARKDRPRNGRDTRFKPKNPGKPKGARDRRTIIGIEAAQAMSGRAWDVIERLLTSSSWRARHEAAKTVLAYALGLPRQTVTVAGGIGDLSRELAAALVEARSRRAALEAAVPAVVPLAPVAEAPALPAEAPSVIEAEVVVKEGEK